MNKQGKSCRAFVTPEGPKVGGGPQETDSSSTRGSVSHGQDCPVTEQTTLVMRELSILGGV